MYTFSNNNFKSFEQLRIEIKLPRTDFFRYLQLRSFILKQPNWKRLIEPSLLEWYLLNIQGGEHMRKPITNVYKIIASMTRDNSFYVKDKWTRELRLKISEEVWLEVCTQAHKVTNANLWKEFQWKINNRFFRTPQVVAKMNPNQSSQCWRGCGETMATHSHIFWQCPLLDNFWKSIFTYINKVLNVDLIRDPLIAILGIKPVVIHSGKKMHLLQILLIAAKKAITIKWFKNESPNQAEWLTNLRNIYTMEKITYSLRLQRELFIERWAPLMTVMEDH